MRVVNFTHGELYALGAYAVFFLEVSLGVNFFLGAGPRRDHRMRRGRGIEFVSCVRFWMRISIPPCW
jgi:branched-chain amino acid transport system permease protein